MGWLWLAKVAEQASDALTALNRALEINPHNERTRAGLDWYRATGQRRAALPACVRRPRPGHDLLPACGALLTLADLPVWQARLPVAADRLQRAAARFEAVLLKKPDAATHLNMALVFLNGKMFDRAAPPPARDPSARGPGDTKQCNPEARRLAETLLCRWKEHRVG